MERQAVTSTSIATVGYDAEMAVLEVEFIGCGVYYYYDVPAEVHEEFLTATSLGAFMNERIKPAYRCVMAQP